VAEWWSIEVLHGEVSAFRWQEQHDSALIEAALPLGMRLGAGPWTVSSTALTVASALVGRALICSFVSCREASSDSSGHPPWPAAHQSARSPSVVSLTASILAGLAMPGNRRTHSRRPTVPERQSTPTR
jgi:hypothetical protein